MTLSAFSKAAGGGQLSLRAGQGAAHLLELGGEAAGQVVAPALDSGTDLGRQVGDLGLVLGFFLFEQGLVGLHHGDALVHPRHLVIHVADILLQDQLGIFRHGDKKSDERAHGAG